jgi:hypothetical protein
MDVVALTPLLQSLGIAKSIPRVSPQIPTVEADARNVVVAIDFSVRLRHRR